MSAFKVDDLVKVTQEESKPEAGFITSIEGPNSYTIEYLDNTSEQQVAVQRLKKGLLVTAHGRPGIVTDRRFKDSSRDDYRVSVMFTDGNDPRADMVEISDLKPAAKGGKRTRRSRKFKSKSRRRR